MSIFMTMKPAILALFLLSTATGCRKTGVNPSDERPGDKLPEQRTVNLTVDGYDRSFIVYLPLGYNNAGKMPLLFVIHGGSGTPEGMIRLADFRSIADKEKVVLVYPAGYQRNWNDGRPTTPNQLGINDVGFFNRMCDYMVANHSVDAGKIYATGISNGGFMSSRLGCELSNRISAIAVVAATIEATSVSPNCNPGRAVPAIYIHGTNDPLVPFTGGLMTAGGTAGGTILSHFQAVERWVGLNRCNASPVMTDLPDIANDGMTVKQRVYSGGTNGSEVVGYVVLNGGHTWPQGFQYLSESVIGPTSQDMNANEVIWAFFKRFRL
jgi:polyhydroxybutyrate depolymerase